MRDVQLLQVPRGVTRVDVRFDMVFRQTLFNDEFGIFVVDDLSGSIGSVHPGDPGYLQALYSRAAVIFEAGSVPGTPDVSIPLSGSAILGFFIVQNGTLAQLVTNNPNNSLGAAPVAFFSVDALNPDSVDHFIAFRGTSLTELAFEDLTGGGDFDYDDVAFTISPILDLPAAAPLFTYIGAGDSVAAGEDIDGKPENKAFAYPQHVKNAICSDLSLGISSCDDIFFENVAVPGQDTTDFSGNDAGRDAQLSQIINAHPQLVTVTVGIDALLVPTVNCFSDAVQNAKFVNALRLPLLAKVIVVAGVASNCLTNIFNNVEAILSAIYAGLTTIDDTLENSTDANIVVTNYYNPASSALKPHWFWSFLHNSFEDFIGAVNGYISLAAFNRGRFAVADIKSAFTGHEYGMSCSYIEGYRRFPWLIGVHPNKLGQQIIAAVVLETARDHGFIVGSSSPVTTCITRSVASPQIVTLSGVGLRSGLSALIQGTRVEVIGVSPNGYSATLRVPNVFLVGLGSQVDVIVINPNSEAKAFRVDVVPADEN